MSWQSIFFSKEITDDWCDYEARGRQHDEKVTGDDAALLRSIAVEVVGVPRRAAFACLRRQGYRAEKRRGVP